MHRTVDRPAFLMIAAAGAIRHCDTWEGTKIFTILLRASVLRRSGFAAEQSGASANGRWNFAATVPAQRSTRIMPSNDAPISAQVSYPTFRNLARTILGRACNDEHSAPCDSLNTDLTRRPGIRQAVVSGDLLAGRAGEAGRSTSGTT